MPWADTCRSRERLATPAYLASGTGALVRVMAFGLGADSATFRAFVADGVTVVASNDMVEQVALVAKSAHDGGREPTPNTASLLPRVTREPRPAARSCWMTC